jgi:methylated-DNA-[protein]-cysteine S-methyltransferase
MTSTLHNTLFSAIIAAPFGRIGIRADDRAVTEIVYLPAHFPEQPPTNAIAAMAAQQIACYLLNPNMTFDLPLQSVGTAYQQRVWDQIAAIPCGSVLTYGALARQIHSAPRAVGQACGANWYPIVIPCHRVVAASGLGGFAHHDANSGFYTDVKRWLLVHEQVPGVTR